MHGFNHKGVPVTYPKDFHATATQQQVPTSKGQRTYKEALIEAFPDMSISDINRLFRDKAVKVHGFTCEPHEDPDELFSDTYRIAVFQAGKTRGFLFRGDDAHDTDTSPRRPLLHDDDDLSVGSSLPAGSIDAL